MAAMAAISPTALEVDDEDPVWFWAVCWEVCFVYRTCLFQMFALEPEPNRLAMYLQALLEMQRLKTIRYNF